VDLDEMICRSICTSDNAEQRKRLANTIILLGGTTKISGFVDSLEDALINRFSMPGYDQEIDRVEVVLINAQ
jgi:actin-related protein